MRDSVRADRRILAGQEVKSGNPDRNRARGPRWIPGVGRIYERWEQVTTQGNGGTLPESEYVGEYTPVAVPDNPQCCTPETLAEKVQQIDSAYGE